MADGQITVINDSATTLEIYIYGVQSESGVASGRLTANDRHAYNVKGNADYLVRLWKSGTVDAYKYPIVSEPMDAGQSVTIAVIAS